MTQTILTSGRFACVVDDRGATLRSFTRDGAEILATPHAWDPALGHHGAILAPWPGRIAGARYEFDGQVVTTEVNEVATGHAIHGFVFALTWTRIEVSAHRAVWEVVAGPRDGYPFAIKLRVAYSVNDDGLRVETQWHNVGDCSAPFGLGFHPYFAGDSPVDAVSLTVAARTAIDGDPATKLPLAPRQVDAAVDYATPTTLGERVFSRTYGGLERDDRGVAVVTAVFAEWTVQVELDAGFPWVQIFTGDVPDPSLRRRGLAIEPQTCPPNAFVSGHDLLRVEPGESGTATWGVRVSDVDAG